MDRPGPHSDYLALDFPDVRLDAPTLKGRFELLQWLNRTACCEITLENQAA